MSSSDRAILDDEAAWSLAIWQGSRTLWERLEATPGVARAAPVSRSEATSESGVEAGGEEGSSGGKGALVEAWIQRVSEGHEARFERRLAWDGFDLATVEGRLAAGLPEQRDLEIPATDREWISFLCEARRRFEQAMPDRGASKTDPEQPPFEAILLPFGELGVERLRDKISPGEMAPQVEIELRNFLVARLSRFAAPTLYEAFASFRAGWQAQAGGRAGSFRAFLARCRDAEWARLLSEYPVLARALASLTLSAVEGLAEFWQRLEVDRKRLEEVFSGGRPLGAPVSIAAGLSDRHAGGRQVCAVVFENGTKLYYKPRCLSLDLAFQDWIRDLREDQVLEAFLPEPHRIVTGDGYGWMESLEGSSFEDLFAVQRYFRRAGGLLCLVYALEGRDFIMDNLIAGEGGPHPIDCEALLQPLAGPAAGTMPAEREEYVEQLLDHYDFTVRDTGFLPHWQTGADGKAYDISGLGGVLSYRSRATELVFVDPNQDEMEASRIPVEVGAEGNRVFVGEALQEPSASTRYIVEGFTRVYRHLRSDRERLIGAGHGSLEARFARARSRFLFRSTSIYGSVLQKLAAPECLRSGVTRSLVIELLAKPFVRRGAERPRAWDLVRAEREALENWDIPRFELPTDNLSEWPHLLVSPLEMARRRVAGLSKIDMRLQREWTRNAFRLEPRSAKRPSLTDERVPATEGTRDWEAAGGWIAEAARLGRLMAGTSRRSINLAFERLPCAGNPSLAEKRVSEKVLLSSQRRFLYHGRTGLAMYFASLYRATGSEGFSDLARSLLAGVERFLGDRSGEALASLPIGATSGLSSVVFGLRHCARQLDDPALEAAAWVHAERWLEAGRFERESLPDVTDGLAGAILALTARHGATDSALPETLRMNLIRAGDRLLELARPGPEGEGLLWPDEEGVSYLGYAHGAAGIAAALARLSLVTGEDRFGEAAFGVGDWLWKLAPKASLEERWITAFSQGMPVRQLMEAWCHGTPGILLAWCEMACLPSARERLADLQTWLGWGSRRLVNFPAHRINDLCCGNFGRVEALIEIEQTAASLGIDLPEVAAEKATALREAENAVGLLPVGFKESDAWLLPPGFFRGYSGVGYEYLRLSDRRAFPSVLRFA